MSGLHPAKLGVTADGKIWSASWPVMHERGSNG
jgi:hypothetical protein